jgi:hypothetical protein
MPDRLTLCDLNDELLQVIASHLCLESLCNLGRVSKRFTFVNTCNQLWKGLYLQEFDSTDIPEPKDGWQQAFKDRWWEEILAEAAEEMQAELDGSWEDNYGWEDEAANDWGENSGGDWSD